MLRDDIALSLLRLPPDLIIHLLEVYPSASAILSATKEELMDEGGVFERLADRIASCPTYAAADRELEFIDRWGIRATAFSDDNYPTLLRETPDAPSLIYTKGDFDFNNERNRFLGVVGTRKMSAAGEAVTRKVIGELAELSSDTVIVSGLAYGIDGVAHRAALDNGLRTVAVVAHGLDTIYPSQHRDLAKRIIENGGAIVTEYPSGTAPLPPHFLARNRIVAGICEALFVAESPNKGGSLVTADIADSYGRELFAAPGRATDKSFEGCIGLIRSNKANLCTCGDDIARLMRWNNDNPATERKLPFLSLTEHEQALYDAFESGEEIDKESLIERSGLSVADASKALTMMQLHGVIKAVKGMMYIKLK